MKPIYTRAKDQIILALAALAAGKLQLAGKQLLLASQEPDFAEFQKELNDQQEAATAEQNAEQTALASLVEGMADVNDMSDLLEDLDDGEIEEPDDVAVDAVPSGGTVKVDVEEEVLEASVLETAATERLARTQRNLARRK